MTSGFAIIPGPHDRLDPIARGVRWWLAQLMSFLPVQERAQIAIDDLAARPDMPLPQRIAVTVPASDVFLTSVRLPPASSLVHRKALKLKLAELAPLDPNTLHIVARASPGSADGTMRYRLAMVRDDRIARADQLARDRGARDIVFRPSSEPDLVVLSSEGRRRRRTSMFMNLALGLGLFASAAAVSTVASDAVLRNAESRAGAEQELRVRVVARERAAAGVALSEAAITEGVLERRPGRLIEDLAAINDATPDGTWWTTVRWSGDGVELLGASAQASPALQTLSDALPEWNVSLSGSVRPVPETGGQQFQLRFTRRSEAP